MSWLARLAAAVGTPPALIGPGRLLLVVGPSGAGKDTLIAKAREACATDASVVFPRRLVTRAASVYEDNDPISEQAFVEGVANGAFAFWWGAHGLQYGVPLTIENDIRQGRTVVCNVSRTVVADLRERYAAVVVVLVTAPPEVLAARLQARARPTDGPVDERLRRSALVDRELRAEVVIHNVADPDSAAEKLLAAIRMPAGAVTL